MKIANVTVVVDPTHMLPKRGVTPAEALILYAMHRAGANGSPLVDLIVQPGEAVTVITPAKRGEGAYYDSHRGVHVPAVDPVPEVTRPRTNAEEIERLRRTYHGTIKVGDKNVPAFEAVFGMQARIQLPSTFEEIADSLEGVEIQVQQTAAPVPGPASNVLRNDGPTIEEYVAAGYDPAGYPPNGYLAKSSVGWSAELERRAKAAEEVAAREKSGGPTPEPQQNADGLGVPAPSVPTAPEPPKPAANKPPKPAANKPPKAN